MVTSVISLLTGGVLSIVGLLLALFPTVSLSSLPIGAPQWVTDSLGLINYFISISDLLTIITVWALAVLAVNVAMIVSRMVSSIKK